MTTTIPSGRDFPARRSRLQQLSEQTIEDQSWLDTLADPLQKWVSGLNSPLLRKCKDFLHGTWLGHPVHPVVTDVPVGAWTSTMLLDAVWLATEQSGLAQASDMTLLLGICGAGVSAVTGLTDWSETNPNARRVGMAHGLLNSGALLSNLCSYALRRTGNRHAGIVVSGIGYALTMVASYLGGEMSYSKGVAVSRVAWEEGPDDYVAVLDASDLPDKTLTRVEASGVPVVLWKENQKIYALAATCSHLGGPLDQGSCEDGAVQCPWHGSRFRLSDGAVVTGPAVYPQPTFDVRVRSGKIELRRLEQA